MGFFFLIQFANNSCEKNRSSIRTLLGKLEKRCGRYFILFRNILGKFKYPLFSLVQYFLSIAVVTTTSLIKVVQNHSKYICIISYFDDVIVISDKVFIKIKFMRYQYLLILSHKSPLKNSFQLEFPGSVFTEKFFINNRSSLIKMTQKVEWVIHI